MTGLPAIGARLLPCEFTDCDGNAVTLDSGPLVLLIDRGFWCAHCREQLEQLNTIADDVCILGFRLVTVSADNQEDCSRATAATKPEIEVMRDPGAHWITANGLLDAEERTRPTALPSMFVIDASGQVRYRYLGRHAGDRPTTSLLLLAAESLIDT